MIDTMTAVKAAIRKVTFIEDDKISPEKDLADDLGIDSIDKVELSLEIETALADGTMIDDGDVLDVRTVDDLVKAVDVCRAR